MDTQTQHTHLYLRFPADIHTWIKKSAKVKRMTINGYMVQAMLEAMAREGVSEWPQW